MGTQMQQQNSFTQPHFFQHAKCIISRREILGQKSFLIHKLKMQQFSLLAHSSIPAPQIHDQEGEVDVWGVRS